MSDDDGVTINREMGVYVLPCEEGYSCLGFDVAERRTEKLREWILSEGVEDAPEIDYALKGTLAGYQQYCRFVILASKLRSEIGCVIPVELTPQLIGLEGKMVEVVKSDGETRRFRVARSTGTIPIHIEVDVEDGELDGFPVIGTPFQKISVLD